MGDTSQPPPQASTSRKPRPATSSDPYANYSNAASLGLVDSEYEASFAAAREARQSEGNVGAWEHVTVASTSLSTLDNNDPEAHWSAKEREERRPTSKSFQEKTLDTDELYDPAAISIKLKRPKSKLEDTQLSASMKDDEGDVESTTQKKGFRKISEISPSSMAKSEEGITPDSSQLQRPSPLDAPFTTTAEDVKPDVDAATAPRSMFKKRKGAASSGSAAQRRKL